MRIFIGVLVALSGAGVQAKPILWTLEEVVFSDGATARGSFVYDAAADYFSSLEISAQASSRKGFESPVTYTDFVYPSAADVLRMNSTADVPCHQGFCSRTFDLSFDTPQPDPQNPHPYDWPMLPEDGGTVALRATTEESLGARKIYSRAIVSGSVTGTPVSLNDISIDVQPHDVSNFIDTGGDLFGPVYVAILTTNLAAGEARDFDALQVDPSSVSFGPGSANVVDVRVLDVDVDGDMDLQLEFPLAPTQITCEYPDPVNLIGQNFAGEALTGSDTVTTPACPGCHP